MLPSSAVNKAYFCYAHDSAKGLVITANGLCLFSIFDTCSTGLEIVSMDVQSIVGNTFYNCPKAVSATDSYAVVAINNIVDTATDGFLWTTQTNINFFAYNHVGNSVTDMWDLVEETVAAHKDNWVIGGAGRARVYQRSRWRFKP